MENLTMMAICQWNDNDVIDIFIEERDELLYIDSSAAKDVDKVINKIIKKSGVRSKYQRFWIDGEDLVCDYGSYTNFIILRKKKGAVNIT